MSPIKNYHSSTVRDEGEHKIQQLLEVNADIENNFLQKSKMLELERYYFKLSSVDRQNFIHKLLTYKIKENFEDKEAGKLIMWSLVSLIRTEFLRSYSEKPENKFSDQFCRLLLPEDTEPTRRDFKEVVSIRQQLGKKDPFNPIWVTIDFRAGIYFLACGDFLKSVASYPRATYDDYHILTNKEKDSLAKFQWDLRTKEKYQKSREEKRKCLKPTIKVSQKIRHEKFNSSCKNKEGTQKNQEKKFKTGLPISKEIKATEKEKLMAISTEIEPILCLQEIENEEAKLQEPEQIPIIKEKLQEPEQIPIKEKLQELEQIPIKEKSDMEIAGELLSAELISLISLPLEEYNTQSWREASLKWLRSIQKAKGEAEFNIGEQFSVLLTYFELNFIKIDPCNFMALLRACVEFLSLPFLKMEEIPENLHQQFQKYLTEASKNFPIYWKFEREIRSHYKSLLGDLNNCYENETISNDFVNNFHKLNLSVCNLTRIRNELVALPNNAYAQKQKICEMMYIHRRLPNKDVGEFLEEFLKDSNNFERDTAKLLLWTLVEILDSRHFIPNVKIRVGLDRLFRNSSFPDIVSMAEVPISTFNELVSIRQELGRKLPKNYSFKIIDKIVSGYTTMDWNGAIFSNCRKPSINFYIHPTEIEKKKIEVLEASLRYALANEPPAKIEDCVPIYQANELKNTHEIKSDDPKKSGNDSSPNLKNKPIQMCSEKSPAITNSSSAIKFGAKKRKSNESTSKDSPITKKKFMSPEEITAIRQRVVQSFKPKTGPSKSISKFGKIGVSSKPWSYSNIPSKNSIKSSESIPSQETPTDNGLEKPNSGKVFNEIKQKLMKTQTSVSKGSSTNIIGAKMEVLLCDDFLSEDYVDQILSPSFLGQELKIVNGKIAIKIVHSLKNQVKTGDQLIK